jgi:mediator of RNA polymerase II transcription subunit 6
MTDQSFKDTVFLESFGLTPWNVLDYFSKSQFYDSSCINEQLKMQQRFNTLDVSDQGLLGSSYELWYYSESLFVIKKLEKTLNSVTLTGVYYIVQGTIYQAPTLSQVLKNRLSTALYHLQAAFEQSQKKSIGSTDS